MVLVVSHNCRPFRKRKIQSEINEKLLKEFSKLVDVSPDIP